MNKFTVTLILLVYIYRLEYVIPDKIEEHFATKTPYRLIANDDLNLGFYPGCEVKKIWMMIRHGTRYPSAKQIRSMKENLPRIRDEIIEMYDKGRGYLTTQELHDLKDWFPMDVKESEEKNLVDEGGDEMCLLAKRTRKRFADIIPEKFNNKTIKLRHTSTERANESAKHFARGLFGEDAKNIVTLPALQQRDPVLRFYKKCASWREMVKNNNQTFKELELYLKSKEMKTALVSVSKKLGLSKILNYDYGKLIFQTCAFETAANKSKISPWCSAFTEESIEPFEYAEDLKQYWMNGHEHEITKKLPCKVIEDIVSFFDTPAGHLSAFHFTHSGTVLKTLAFFGLFKPKSPLLHSIRDPNRAWRSSRIDAFGSNLAFLLYRCGSSNKFLTLHQERPVRFPGCEDSDLCPLEILEGTQMKEDCDIEKICKMPFLKNEL